jgi:hypothetical protein
MAPGDLRAHVQKKGGETGIEARARKILYTGYRQRSQGEFIRGGEGWCVGGKMEGSKRKFLRRVRKYALILL